MGNIVQTTLSAGQSSKEATISQMVDELDTGLTEILALDATGNVNVTANATQLRTAIKFKVSGHTTAVDLTFTAPVKKQIIVENAGTGNLTAVVGSGSKLLAPASSMMFYLDGTTNGIKAAITSAGSLVGLTDVNITTGSGVDGYSVVWDNATGKFILSAITGGGGGGGSGGTLLDKDRYAPPLVADFPTLVGTNSTNPNVTFTTTGGLTVGSGVNQASGDNVRGCFRALPTGTTWEITTKFKANYRGLSYNTLALALRESGSGKQILWGFDTTQLDLTYWASPTSFGSTPWVNNTSYNAIPEWFKIASDATNLYFYTSHDGVTWLLLYQASRTAYMTGGPDEVGFSLHVSHNDANWTTPTTGNDAALSVYYFDDGDTLLAPSRAIGIGGVSNGLSSHRAWRLRYLSTIEFPTVNGGGFCTLTELQFLDASSTPIATTGGDVLSYNNNVSFPGANAFDGSGSTQWSSNAALTAELTVGPGYVFASDTAVAGVTITGPLSGVENHAPRDFAIQYSDDLGATWFTAGLFASTSSWTAAEQRTFTLPASGVTKLG